MQRIFNTIFTSAVCLLVSTAPVHAYIDPGTGSLVVQAVIGGLTAGITVAGIYWRKVLDAFSRMFPSRNVSEVEHLKNKDD